STPFLANLLTSWVELRAPDLDAALAGKDKEKVALVVLAGGVQTADESLPLRERLDAATTHRVLTASRLVRDEGFGLMILSGNPPVTGEAMRDLALAVGVPRGRMVLESTSGNTRENAAFSAAILRERRPEAV